MKKFIGNKRLVVSICAVLVAVSAFFYAPMDVSAEVSSTVNKFYNNYHTFQLRDPNYVYLKDYLDSDEGFYDIAVTVTANFESNIPTFLNNFFVTFNSCGMFEQMSYNSSAYQTNLVHTETRHFYLDASSSRDFTKFDVRYYFIAGFSSTPSSFTCNCSYTIDNVAVSQISLSDYESYQSGYNAGYSAGEQAGEDIGYSNGFEEGFEQGESQGYESGFQAGQDSVDTQSYYDAGYNAGYNAGYSSGYDEGYDEGYSKALKAVQGSSGAWGSPMFVGTPTKIKRYGQGFYVSSYGLLDMEEYQSGVNGYFYNTVPGTYDGHTIISYNIPFYSFNNGLVKIDSDKFQVDFGLRDLDISVECDDGNGTELANLMESRLNEVYVVYNGRKYYGNYDIGTGYVEFDFIAEGVGNPTYLNTGSMTLCFDIHNTVTLVTDADVSHFISAKYYNVLECSLGIPSNSYAIYIRPYLENDRVSANIQDQTDKITGNLDEQKEIQQGQLVEQKEQTETQKGIAASIKEFFGSFFDNLINSIIHVIVPTKEEMGELFNRLNDFFSETFGFLYYPFEFIINAFNIFLVADSGTGLTLPAFSIMGYEVWGNQTYDIASEPIVGEIFGFVRMGTGAMLVMWFVNFLKDFFDKRFGGGGN